MADNQLRVSLTATDDGLKATIDNAVRDINRVQAATEQAARSSSSAMQEAGGAIGNQTREIAQSVRTISALLASGYITKLTGDYVDFGNIVSAVFAGRLVGSVAQFTAETFNSVSAAADQRRAMIAAAEAATVQHRALSVQYAALVASGQASTIYTQNLRAQVAASAAATVAARAQAASMGLLRGMYATLGGPVGIITIAASALALWATFARSADDETKKLTKSTGALGAASDKLSGQVIAQRIVDLQDLLSKITSNPANDASSGAAAGLRRMIDGYQQVLKDDAALQDRIAKVLQAARPQKEEKSSSVAVFKDEYDTLRKAYEDHQTQLAAVNTALDEQYAKVTLTARGYYDFTLAQKGLNEEERAAALTRWDTVRGLEAVADNAKAAQSILAELYPSQSKETKFQQDAAVITEYMTRIGASSEQVGQTLAELSKQFVGVAKEAKESGNEVAQIYEDTASSIRSSFRDTFRDVFDHGLDGFSGFRKRMLGVFKDMLADMATLAIARPIIVPIVTSIGGLLGVSGSAQAGVLGQLGVSGAGAGAGALSGITGAFGGGFQAGLSGGFGAASLAASGGAFTTGAGTASAFGAYAGAAAPIAAGALGYYALADMVSGGSARRRNLSLLFGPTAGLVDRIGGGGLFGTGTRTTSTGLELNVSGGAVMGREFQDRERKKSFFRGKDEWTDYSPADAQLLRGINGAVGADMSQLVAGARGLGVNTAQGILSGFASQARLSLQGKSQEEVQKAIQDWIDTTLGSMAKAVLKDTKWSGLLKDASREMVESLFSLGRFFSANPLADANEMMRVASRTYRQQLDDQRKALLSLSAVYDGSVGATQNLAAAAKDYYQMELAYLQQIAAVRTDVRATLGGSIENIRQSVMAPDQLYTYLQSRSAGLANQLSGATDPTRIADIVREINATSSQAYNLIPEAERAAFAEQFVSFLTGVQATADQRLNVAQDEVVNIHRDLSTTVSTTMQGVSDRLSDSARDLKAAAGAITIAADVLKRALQQSGYYKYG